MSPVPEIFSPYPFTFKKKSQTYTKCWKNSPIHVHIHLDSPINLPHLLYLPASFSFEGSLQIFTHFTPKYLNIYLLKTIPLIPMILLYHYYASKLNMIQLLSDMQSISNYSDGSKIVLYSSFFKSRI